MKKFIQTTFVLLAINTSIMAQKGFDVKKEITINVSAEKLWDMVGNGFVDVYKWSSNVDHASGSGTAEFSGATCSERSCDVNVKGFSKIHEKLVEYDEKQMVLAYEVMEGMPGFVTKAVNQWTVVAIDENHSKLVMKAEFRSKGLMGSMMNGMMEKKMNQTLLTVLNDAKVFAETGMVSPAKRERMESLAKKMKQAA
jgi:ribosome-associated toxin RatA of RatAB toxin-antitoxin module